MLKKLCSSFSKLNTSQALSACRVKNCFSTNIKEKIYTERQERLKAGGTYLPIQSFNDLNLIRNFGLISHIDAGKTTTTEKMLYYSGAVVVPGSVDDGTTIMDCMELERDRGLTIRSGAITFSWKKHQFNLIDTPGHIDFIADVESSLRVLDGAITIFDSVRGLQAQSETVWRQANKFKLPKIVFINKMDKMNASLESCLESIKERLKVDPLVVQIPVFSSEHFEGVIDLINMKKITWEDEFGDEIKHEEISKGSEIYEKAKAARDKLIEAVSVYDEGLAKDYLDNKIIDPTRLESSIREAVLNNPLNTCTVFVGSSGKNKGIQTLMDGIIKYLPSPLERGPVVGWDSGSQRDIFRHPKKDEKLCAFVFKVVNDLFKGQLAYVRIYSGTLTNRCHLYNTSRNIYEKGAQIYRVRADQYIETNELHAGDIAAIYGLKGSFAADTLIDQKDTDRIVLQGVETQAPVFVASIEYNSFEEKSKLDKACATLTKEDPSLIVEENEETGQILVYGLGELHLEVFRDRLESEFGVKIRLGKTRVSYRESVGEAYQLGAKLLKTVAGRPTYSHVELKIEPAIPEDFSSAEHTVVSPTTPKTIIGGNILEFDFGQNPEFMRLYNEYKQRIRRNQTAPISDRLDEQPAEDQEGPFVLPNMKEIRRAETHGHAIEEVSDEFGHDKRFALKSAPFELIYGIELAVQNALLKGQLIGAPILHTKISIVGGSYSEERSNHLTFEMCTANLMEDLLKRAKKVLLEPVMELDVSIPVKMVDHVVNDIMANRRGIITEIKQEVEPKDSEGTQRNLINAVVPLDEVLGYGSDLRSLTKGEAHFVMRFKQYDRLGEPKQKEVIDNYI